MKDKAKGVVFIFMVSRQVCCGVYVVTGGCLVIARFYKRQEGELQTPRGHETIPPLSESLEISFSALLKIFRFFCARRPYLQPATADGSDVFFVLLLLSLLYTGGARRSECRSGNEGNIGNGRGKERGRKDGVEKKGEERAIIQRNRKQKRK